MDYNKAALELHEKYPGKIAVKSLVECRNTDALSTALHPRRGGSPAATSRQTRRRSTATPARDAWWRWSPTAPPCWGLGNIGPEAALPVMEGKCVLFKEFGGVDAFPICIDAKTKEEVIAAVKGDCPHLRRHQPGGHPQPRVLRDRGDAGAGAGHSRLPR